MSHMPEDLAIAIGALYEPAGFFCRTITDDIESKEYGGRQFLLNNHRVLFRMAKITPKKIGQFVTLYKRVKEGFIAPYTAEDPFDMVIISARQNQNLGQFILSKKALIEQGFLATKSDKGKMAFRIYPPWDKPSSLQAEKTQRWQKRYFISIIGGEPIDQYKVLSLLRNES